MSQENEIEAENRKPTQDFLPSDGASCSASIPWKRYVPGDKAADIWLKLHDTIGNNIGIDDSLNSDERSLYNALTKLFAADFSMVGYSVSEFENSLPNVEPIHGEKDA